MSPSNFDCAWVVKGITYNDNNINKFLVVFISLSLLSVVVKFMKSVYFEVGQGVDGVL